ncbi:hypothetical protein CRG98_039373, partial [Punica granatum]
MAVAMASASFALQLKAVEMNSKAFENSTSRSLAASSAGFGSFKSAIRPSWSFCPIRLPSSRTTLVIRASSAAALEDESPSEADAVPTPKVIIDQDSDPNATVVEITFGDRLGALIDT